jgi:hypothetical protein
VRRRPASIEMLVGESGPQMIAEGLPLQGISIDGSGSRPSSVEISLGDEVGHHVSHTVDMPLYIRQLEQADGSVELAIESADGAVTLIHVGKAN